MKRKGGCRHALKIHRQAAEYHGSRSDRQSVEWRRGFVRTFLERDIPQFGIRVPAATLRRFFAMLAHSHGQVWNAAEFARSFGVGKSTHGRTRFPWGNGSARFRSVDCLK